MKLQKLAVLAMTGLLALGSVTSAMAAKNTKYTADELDIPAIIEDKTGSGSASVYHWWTAGGEKDAIESIIADFDAAYEGTKAKSNAIPGGAGGAMVMKVKVLQQAGKSPETFQAHAGEEIVPYLSADMLLNLNKVWEYESISDRLLPGIEEFCTASDGNKYVVPVGISRTNVIYYNIHVFEKYGVAIPDHEDITWDEFWDICEQLYNAMEDDDLYPIDMGDSKGWPATQVFEDIMMGTDARIYQDFINGKATEADVKTVLDNYKRLLTYVTPDHACRDWYEATGMMVNGEFAMQIMGSWMQPVLTSMGQVYGVDYGVFTFPGTSGWYGLNIDGFVVSNDSADVAAGVRWVANVTTTEVQINFAARKECISPYTDTPDSAYDASPRTLLDKQLLTSGTVKTYPSFTHGTALPWAASSTVQTHIQSFAVASDPDTARYAKLIVDVLKESGVKGEWNLVD